MHRPRSEPAELVTDVVRADAGSVHERAGLRQRDDSRSGSNQRGAPGSVESSLLDDAVLEHQRDPHEVAAGSAAGRPGERRVREPAASVRPGEMLLEGTAGVVHESYRRKVGPG